MIGLLFKRNTDNFPRSDFVSVYCVVHFVIVLSNFFTVIPHTSGENVDHQNVDDHSDNAQYKHDDDALSAEAVCYFLPVYPYLFKQKS